MSNLIANTTDQKFLQAILVELQKTNELLASLCSMRKDAEKKKENDNAVKESRKTRETPIKRRKSDENSTSKRSEDNNKSSGNGPKRGRKRKTVHDS